MKLGKYFLCILSITFFSLTISTFEIFYDKDDIFSDKYDNDSYDDDNSTEVMKLHGKTLLPWEKCKIKLESDSDIVAWVLYLVQEMMTNIKERMI